MKPPMGASGTSTKAETSKHGYDKTMNKRLTTLEKIMSSRIQRACSDSSFFFSSRRRHTRCSRDWSSRRVLFRSERRKDALRSGRVPTPEAKEAVLRMVRDEAARVRSDVQIEERLSVVPTTARVA